MKARHAFALLGLVGLVAIWAIVHFFPANVGWMRLASLGTVAMFALYLGALGFETRRKYTDLVQVESGVLRPSKRPSKVLFWVGIALIAFAFCWIFIAPSIVDVDTDLGAYLDMGGMVLLLLIGVGLIASQGFNIWTLVRPGGRERR